MTLGIGLVVALVGVASIAGPSDSLPAAGRAAQVAGSALAAYDLGRSDPVQFELAGVLREVSGLAVDDRGRVFAHHDERAIVFELDPGTGRVTKTFRVGRNGVRGDFEGIAVAGQRMFLASSTGRLVEFADAADGASVEYRLHDARTRGRCREVEGLDYDGMTGSLLLACKITAGRDQRGRLLVLGFGTGGMRPDSLPRISVPLEFLRRRGLKAELSPSALAIHPLTGTLFVVAARENLVVELSRSGEVLDVAPLRRAFHRQAEGLAFAPDGRMFIADEGRGGRATLSVYRPLPGRLPGSAR